MLASSVSSVGAVAGGSPLLILASSSSNMCFLKRSSGGAGLAAFVHLRSTLLNMQHDDEMNVTPPASRPAFLFLLILNILELDIAADG